MPPRRDVKKLSITGTYVICMYSAQSSSGGSVADPHHGARYLYILGECELMICEEKNKKGSGGKKIKTCA